MEQLLPQQSEPGEREYLPKLQRIVLNRSRYNTLKAGTMKREYLNACVNDLH